MQPRLHSTLEACCENLKASYDIIGADDKQIDQQVFAKARNMVREFNLHKSVASSLTRPAPKARTVKLFTT